VQLGAAVDFELLEFAGLDGEQRSLAVGFGELKSVGGLLYVDANPVGKFLQHIAEAQAGVEIRPSYYGDKQQGDYGQPAAEAVNGERHR
jgi:hypothetical protein